MKRSIFLFPLLLVALAATDARSIVLHESQDGLTEIVVPRELEPEVDGADKELGSALKSLAEGKADEAERAAREVIKGRPGSAAAHEIAGAALLMKGDIDGGIELLRKALALNPAQSSALTKIGDAYLARKNYGEAKRYFERALRISPEDRKVNQRMGIISEVEGKIDQAISFYERGVAGTPAEYAGVKVNLGRLYNAKGMFSRTVDLLSKSRASSADARLVLGTAYLGLGKSAPAIVEFKAVKAAEPKSGRGQMALGIAYRAAGDNKSSVSELREALSLKPDSAHAHMQLGETYYAMKDSGAALESFEAAARASKDAASAARQRKAEIYLEQKRYVEAIQTCDTIVKSGRATMKTYDMLGTAYQFSNRHKEAEGAFREMARAFPKSAFPSYRLGLFYGYSKKYDAAIEQFRKALAIEPENPVTLKAMAIAYGKKGDNARAIEAAEKAVKASPGSVDEKFFLASLHHASGSKARAGELYGEILAVKADYLPALNNQANLLNETGKPAEALTLAKKAAELAPGDGLVLDTLGWVLLSVKDSKGSLEVLRKASKAAPGNPTVSYHLAVSYAANGDSRSAMEELEKAARHKGAFPEYNETLRMIERLKGAR